MKLIVGLGNYGKDYENTRHNIGYMLIDYIASKKNIEISNKGFKSLETNMLIKGEKVILIKPLTYMNNSGQALRMYMDYYKIEKSDILIIQDDKDMEFLKVKLVKNSSSGGHNGIRSIEENIQTKDYLRLKLGIGSVKNTNTKKFVLDKFSKSELSEINNKFIIFDSLLEDFISFNFQQLTSKYNGK